MVRLRLCAEGEEPDLFIQRVADNLFIFCTTISVGRWKPREGGKIKTAILGKHRFVEEKEVPHVNRISNKLFPEVTEESGVTGVMIERIPR